MRIKTEMVAGLTMAFVLSFSLNAWSLEPAKENDTAKQQTTATAAEQSQIEKDSQSLAVTYSRLCATNEGICELSDPLPIGSPCLCGTVPGTVIR